MEKEKVVEFKNYIDCISSNSNPFENDEQKAQFINDQIDNDYATAMQNFKHLVNQKTNKTTEAQFNALEIELLKIIIQKKQLEKTLVKSFNGWTWATIIVFMFDWLFLKDMSLTWSELWIMGASFLALIIAATLKNRHTLVKKAITKATTPMQRGEFEQAYRNLKAHRKPIKATIKAAQKKRKSIKYVLPLYPELQTEYDATIKTITINQQALRESKTQWRNLKTIHKYLKPSETIQVRND